MRRLSTQPTAYAAPSPLPAERAATVCGGPYGMQMQVPWSDMWAQPYKFMGKELDRENGWDSYDVHARWLTSPIAQWTTQDPLAEANPWLSPYSYCAANPIRYIDPTGETIEFNGNQEDLLLVLDILNKTVGDYYQFILNEKNELEMNYVDGADLSHMDKSQQMVANTMQQMIYNGFTSINVEHQSNEYIIGRNETNSIDISDINAIGSGDKPMTSIGALIHESYENYLTQVKGVSLLSAHNSTISRETQVTGYSIPFDQRSFKETGINICSNSFPRNVILIISTKKNNIENVRVY